MKKRSQTPKEKLESPPMRQNAYSLASDVQSHNSKMKSLFTQNMFVITVLHRYGLDITDLDYSAVEGKDCKIVANTKNPNLILNSKHKKA